ncbi:hypothetical protein RFI_17709, partial [Reticulomyxa filosa]
FGLLSKTLAIQLTQGIGNVVMFAIGLYCWTQSPRFLDMFALRRELRYLGTIGICSVVIWIILTIVAETKGRVLLLRFLITTDYVVTILFVQYLHTHYVLVLCGFDYGLLPWAVFYAPCSKKKYGPSGEHKISGVRSLSAGVEPITSETALRMVLQKSEYLTLFAQFLEKEYSLENLLAFVELHQFLGEMISEYQVLNESWNETFRSYVLCEEMPLSYINQQGQKDEWGTKFKMLHDKYLNGYNSVYELNISGSLRRQCLQIVEKPDFTLEDVVALLVSVLQSVVYLLIDSLTRFRQTPEYHNAEHLIIEKGL